MYITKDEIKLEKMVVYAVFSLCMMMILPFETNCQQLLGNYKLWDSTGNQVAYDYSGNSNPAVIENSCTQTERGLFFSWGCTIRLPTNTLKQNPGYQEVILSCWILKKFSSMDMNIGNSISAQNIKIAMRAFNRFEIYRSYGVSTADCGSACNTGNIYFRWMELLYSLDQHICNIYYF